MQHMYLSAEALAEMNAEQSLIRAKAEAGRLAEMDREQFCRHLAACMAEITARGIPIADLWGAMLGRVEARRDG